MTQQLTILLVPHTHWDREWYQTFQQFRIRLVQAIDKLLNILDRDDTFHHFMLDGQTIILDDYLEIQPEQEERLRQHIRSGRILVGPWYVQPDEFLVSGESLIRNLQVGLRQAINFGNPMYVGYVPDSFGHIAQLPQIFQGVGIDNAVFWRGVGAEAKQSEFYWEAPDGSSVLVAHLADPIGYSNARHMPLNPEEFVTRVELLVANILPKANTQTLLFMNGSDHLEIQEGLPATIQAANELMKAIDPSRKNLLAHLSNDYTSDESIKNYDSISVQIGTLPQYIENLRQYEKLDALQTLTGEMRSSQYSHLLPSVLSSRMWIKQQNTATEHLLERWVEPLTAWAWKTGAPYPQGFIHTAWRYLLQNHPHDSICGCSLDQVHRENAVRFAQSQQIAESLLQQAMQQIVQATDTRAPFPTPHASYEPVAIVVFNPAPGPRSEVVRTEVQLPGSLHNAVIVDQHCTSLPYLVVNRWRQEIGSSPFAREMLAAAIMISGVTSPAQLVQLTHNTIVSTLGQSYESYVISRVHIQDSTSSPVHQNTHTAQAGVVYIEIMIAPKGHVLVNEQEITTAGQHMLDLLAREDIHTLEVSLVDQARETIDFLATDVPAYGQKTFWLYPRGLKESTIEGQEQLRKSVLLARQNRIENEFYSIEANTQDGTLTITEKTTGEIFTGLNRFVDGGDVGDLYNYCPPEQDVLVSEPIEPPTIEVIGAEPVSVTLRVTSCIALPDSCTTNRTARSASTTICAISSDITLFPGVRRITIHTSVDNSVKDHRLRVLFPIPYKTEEVAVEGTFEVRMRPISQTVAQDVAEWIEKPVNVFPQKRFVDVSDGKHGFAVLNRGLPEYEIVQSDPSVTGENQMAIALTLLRCVEWLSRGDLSTRRGHAGPMMYTPEAQCLGHSEFDYALVPHTGTWQSEEAFVLREAQAFNTPIHTRTIVAEQHEGQLPAQAAFVEVEPRELVVSAIKRSDDGRGLVVRVYNPLSSTIKAKIQPGVAFVQAYMTNLLEERQEAVERTSSHAQAVEVAIRSGEITTLVFE
ncbi:MAG: hypothetical protein NVSMB49_24010 [Ktedonobacteraceae bacterium]